MRREEKIEREEGERGRFGKRGWRERSIKEKSGERRVRLRREWYKERGREE